MNKVTKKLLSYFLKPFASFLYRKYVPHFEEDFHCPRVLMIRELNGGAHKWEGTRRRRAHLGNTHPWNRYFNRPLQRKPKTLLEIEVFLRGCRYLSDRKTRSQKDFWEPPDIFEQRRTGDCEDHAIWAWRQLADLGFRARLALGKCDQGWHAWVLIFVQGRCYLLEPTQKHSWFPDPADYQLSWSVEHGAGKKFMFYQH